MNKFFNKDPQSGNVLLIIIVGLAVLGFTASELSLLFVRANNFSVSAEKDFDISVLRMTVAKRMRCPVNMNSIGNCSGTSPVSVSNRSGANFIPSSGRGLELGKWNLRAVCKIRNGKRGLHIEYGRLLPRANLASNADSDFYKDRQTKSSQKWTDLFDQAVCPDGIGSSSLKSQCIRKRSSVYRGDMVSWCTPDYPQLYHCAQVDDQAPGAGTERPVARLNDCQTDGTCVAKGLIYPTLKQIRKYGTKYGPARDELGPDGMYYERVDKRASGGSRIDGCWLYDKGHAHKPYRADIMCCKGE